jgi:hypothetical protein
MAFHQYELNIIKEIYSEKTIFLKEAQNGLKSIRARAVEHKLKIEFQLSFILLFITTSYGTKYINSSLQVIIGHTFRTPGFLKHNSSFIYVT